MTKPVEAPERDQYCGTDPSKLIEMRECLKVMSGSRKYTHETRLLAADEAAYLDVVLAWRALDTNARGKLLKSGVAPWRGTWFPKETA
tara:strand:+ start:140 stop:403 length:264 start_codon:yes stop_codon:yes gene_type:complete